MVIRILFILQFNRTKSIILKTYDLGETWNLFYVFLKAPTGTHRLYIVTTLGHGKLQACEAFIAIYWPTETEGVWKQEYSKQTDCSIHNQKMSS